MKVNDDDDEGERERNRWWVLLTAGLKPQFPKDIIASKGAV